MKFNELVQILTISTAFLAIILPLWFSKKHKKADAKQKAAEILISLPDDMDYVSKSYIESSNLRILTEYQGNKDFFKQLDKFSDPVRAVETWKKHHLLIKDFPDNPSLKMRRKVIWIPSILFLITFLFSILFMTVSYFSAERSSSASQVLETAKISSNGKFYSVEKINSDTSSKNVTHYISSETSKNVAISNLVFAMISIATGFASGAMIYFSILFIDMSVNYLSVDKEQIRHSMHPIKISDEKTTANLRTLIETISYSLRKYFGLKG
ncbi:hypothetical protein [Pseudoalteromonas sp. PS5]|uniref:hypothetical protein n=1 Tax=Pseudoalteromonas sp. PS5 TaxID=1437473 RepID=UPI000FFF00F4|nr:hypothetical protein [Pseudoalteromonas sp. PS5]RXF03938.1 hypothetical protein D9603_07025 [Pseudoalteromonas sp. PS5]